MLILSHYNISLKDGLVIEDSSSTDYYMTSQTYLIPEINSHDITSPLITSKMSILVPQAGALDIGPEINGVEIDVLLESSDKSYLEPITTDMDGEKDDNAEMGPFALVAAVTKSATQDTEEAKMIVSTNAIMFQAASQMGTQGNYELLINAVSWLSPFEDDFYIRGKSLQTSSLYFQTYTQVIILIVLVTVVIPLLAFAAAIFVYVKRKHL
jgi:ABC-2 type transport system permease protein